MVESNGQQDAVEESTGFMLTEDVNLGQLRRLEQANSLTANEKNRDGGAPTSSTSHSLLFFGT
jgi:hypothetical protein